MIEKRRAEAFGFFALCYRRVYEYLEIFIFTSLLLHIVFDIGRRQQRALFLRQNKAAVSQAAL